MARVVVDVMPKPEILDPQGKAVTGALNRLGFAGVSVRQGKRFELELDGELTDERLAAVRHAAETLLANTVIETFAVKVETEAETVVADTPTAEARPRPRPWNPDPRPSRIPSADDGTDRRRHLSRLPGRPRRAAGGAAGGRRGGSRSGTATTP